MTIDSCDGITTDVLVVPDVPKVAPRKGWRTGFGDGEGSSLTSAVSVGESGPATEVFRGVVSRNKD
jgi:hypothetical protein